MDKQTVNPVQGLLSFLYFSKPILLALVLLPWYSLATQAQTSTNGIDLELSLTQPNATPAQWSSYAVSATLTNTGGASATGIQVSFAKPAGVVYTGGNEWTASQGSFSPFGNEEWTVGSIPAGGSATLTVNYFLLENTAPVAYAQVSAANETDGDSTPGNGTPPSVNEDDEASTGGSGPPVLNPDLTISNLSIQNSPLEAGQVLHYQFDIANQGNGPASGNFTVKAWISTDQNISSDDIQDGTVLTGNYGAGLTQAGIPGASTIPASLAVGQYYHLILKVDADGSISEDNENNNVVSAPFMVSSDSGPGTSCSFTTFYTPSGFNPLDIFFGRFLILQESADGYTVFQDFGNFNSAFSLPDFDTYQLDPEGNVLSAFESPIVPTINVKPSYVGNDTAQLTFHLSPDLPAGTVVTFLLDYPAPPAAVYFNSRALRTSWGYAFTASIIDLSPSVHWVNRVYMTDHVGQNVTFAELPQPDDFSGSNRIFEGPDGSLFTEWLTSGNFSLFVVPGDGSAPWQYLVATDTPASSWKDTDLSHDGQFVYTMKWDNTQTYITKFDVHDGTWASSGPDLETIKTSPLPGGHRTTWAHGMEPTADGGLLVSLQAREATTPDKFEVLAKFNAAGSLLWKLEIPNPEFELTPVGETSDGGALFAGESLTSGHTVFLKTTGNGALAPKCGGSTANGDIDLAISLSANPIDPAIYSNTEVTLTINNAGPQTATGIVVDFARPSGTVYTGGNEWTATQGSFNPFGNEEWTVGSIPAGGSASITVSYFLLSGNALTPYAQVIAANETDVDSSPGNGTCCTPNEDDEATLTLNAFAAGGGVALQTRELIGRPVQLRAVNPNPVYYGKISVVIDSREEGRFNLECYDLFGRFAFLQKIELEDGRNEVPLDVSRLESGTYYLNMPGENWRGMPLRFVVARW